MDECMMIPPLFPVMIDYVRDDFRRQRVLPTGKYGRWYMYNIDD